MSGILSTLKGVSDKFSDWLFVGLLPEEHRPYQYGDDINKIVSTPSLISYGVIALVGYTIYKYMWR